MMKKLTVALLMVSWLLSVGLTVPAAAANSSIALKSDIVCEVNGVRLPCLIINQRTAVVAEDLRQGGLEVIWLPSERRLLVLPGNGQPQRIGDVTDSFAQQNRSILKTDIKTLRQGGEEIPSFNLDGFTAIYLRDLQAYGEVKWDETQRLATFVSAATVTQEQQHTEQANKAHIIIHTDQASTFNAEIVFTTSKLQMDKQTVGFISQGQAFVDISWLQAQLGYTLRPEGNAYVLSQGDYSFKVIPGSQQATLYYGGAPINSKDITAAPQIKNGHLFLNAPDTEDLFGLGAVWNQQNRTWSITYKNYKVEDRGNYNNRGSSCQVLFSFEPALHGNDDLSTYLENTTWKQNPQLLADGYGYGGSGDGQQMDFSCPLLMYKDNELTISVASKSRIIFHKTLSVKAGPQDHYLKTSGIIGPFTNYILTAPQQSYNAVQSPAFPIAGSVHATNSPQLQILLDQLDQKQEWQPISPQQLSLDEQGQFDGRIELPAPGLYRARLTVEISSLHGATTGYFGEFYIDYQP